MTRVSFYINGFNAPASFHCTDLVNGNPGLGGSEYMVLLVASLLQKRENDIDIQVYTTGDVFIPGIERVIAVSDFAEAVSSADKAMQDYLIFCHDSQLINNCVIPTFLKNTKLIVWCHNFATWEELDFYGANPSVWKVISVGKEQHDLYLDHVVMKKSDYIYNSVNTDSTKDYTPNKERGHVVTYMGCVWPRKGFHWLAAAWPDVIKEIPDAELYVIGTGKLYGWDSKLGKYGLAEERYERSFMGFLENNGELMPGVHLMGVLGKEKNDILRRTKVGVPNPSGNTETFCITAVEMQMMGARVVMGKCPGSLDTVIDGSLVSKQKRLSQEIVSMLKSKEDDHDYAIQVFSRLFSHDSVLENWEQLLTQGVIIHRDDRKNITYRFKWLKRLIGCVKSHVSILGCLPPVERLVLIFERAFGRGKSMYQYIPQQYK